MLSNLDYNNITIVEVGLVYVDNENNVIDFEENISALHKDGKARPILSCTYGMSLKDFLDKCKNKKAILNLMSSDLTKNRINGYIFENKL